MGHIAIEKGFSGSLAWDMNEDKAVGIVVARDSRASLLIPCATLQAAFVEAFGNDADTGTGAGLAGSAAMSAAADADKHLHEPHDVFLWHNSRDKPQVRSMRRTIDVPTLDRTATISQLAHSLHLGLSDQATGALAPVQFAHILM